MKRTSIIFGILMVFACCKNTANSDRLPAGLMKKVLLDIQLAETYSTMVKDSLHKNIGMRNVDSLAVFYNDIFSHYHITEAQFTSSLDWYKSHPDDMDTLYNDMLGVLAGMQNGLKPTTAAVIPPPVPLNTLKK